MPHRVLITGGAGQMAALLRPRLRRSGRVVRLFDLRQVPGLQFDEESVIGSITDVGVLRDACIGVDAVLHLGGQPTETSWDDILSTNIDGTHALLQVCSELHIPKVILASSNHAVGLLDVAERPIPADAAPQPDSYYGFSKAAIELLGRLFHQRFGMDVSCLRIGRCIQRPPNMRALTNWLSPDDAARLVEACLAVTGAGFRIIWGVSDNTRSWFDQAAGVAIGYHPIDDSEKYAGELPDTGPEEGSDLVGGHFAHRPLGVNARNL